MARTKICGIRTPEDLAIVAAAKGRWAGMVFFEKSPRHISYEDARILRQHADELKNAPDLVALVVDADDDRLAVIAEYANPDMLQCHGSESPEKIATIRDRFAIPVMKALRVTGPDTLINARAYDGAADMLLFDSAPINTDLPGGTGHRFDWGLMQHYTGTTPWMLAGGLEPGNVAEAIRISGAEAVDVSSGVERSPGIKDHAAIQRFVSAALSAKTE
ncbi:phosphoribosylanthranilate isomerase [Alphaproteobacteria bacterium LSUCC0684]